MASHSAELEVTIRRLERAVAELKAATPTAETRQNTAEYSKLKSQVTVLNTRIDTLTNVAISMMELINERTEIIVTLEAVLHRKLRSMQQLDCVRRRESRKRDEAFRTLVLKFARAQGTIIDLLKGETDAAAKAVKRDYFYNRPERKPTS